MRAGLTFLLSAVLVFSSRADSPTSQPVSTNALQPGVTNPNPLVWDAMAKDFTPKGASNILMFTFWVTNTSAAPVSILSVDSSCDCTTPELPPMPWQFKPGATGSMNVRMRTMGRYGLVTKHLVVDTSYGKQMLTVNANIPLTPAPFNVSPRLKDQMAAQKDRQMVFNDIQCAVCHATPASGRMGRELFDAACAICHVSDHRAEMVPDLALLKQATSAEYWRTFIVQGKPGTLMPAFAKSQGGILNTNQIESLVAYLLKAYPSALAQTPTAGK